ncbi:hypothetical protein ACOCJ7_13020 [Knoellia sp. CPCC 206453]|uniref:hypothetical protein n=1 Tax=Knoellia pratensis TaxID=3404796 RepID=UPI00360BFB5C
MTDDARRRHVPVGALALLGAAIVMLLIRCGGPDDTGTGHGGGRATSSGSSFTISGDASEPITPGSRASIDLEFANPRWLPLVVRDVRVSVRAVRAPHADSEHPCGISDYTVEQVPAGTKITIPARATRTLSGLALPERSWPSVELVANPTGNRDGCKGASLELVHGASGSIGW